jgi:MFS family permease
LWLIQEGHTILINNTSSKRLLAITFATSGALSWFFIITHYFPFLFQSVTTNQTSIFIAEVLFFGCGAFSAIIAAMVSGRINRRKLLFSSIILGILTTSLLTILQGEQIALILGSLLGTSFGLSFPSGIALFIDRTKIEQRGRFSGYLVFTTFMLILLGVFAVDILELNLIGVAILIILIRSTSFLTLAADPCIRENTAEKSFLDILKYKEFILYLIPWVIFNLVSGIGNFIFPALPQTSDYASAFKIGNLLQFLGVAVFSLISGFVSDYLGRRPPIIIGIVLFGASFAILGFAPSPLSVIINAAFFGIAWGFCMVAFLAIPGDLAQGKAHEKFYAWNTVLPFIIYMATSTLPTVLGVGAPVNILSPILSMLLFLSVVPILYASETLPSSITQSRKMKEHLRQVEKTVEDSKKEH